MSGYIVVLKNKAMESSKLLSQVDLQNQQLEEIKNRELTARNMIPQYTSDTNKILDEVSSVLPVLKFKTKTNEEQKILTDAKEWILGQEGKKEE